ncbi:hypothetical protein BSK43_011155 [Rhizobium sp. P44RR-XXIV]|nr:hypothetical protein BSK43_011155 [Rhizobium sp. P44RR-XXIV]
MGFGISVFVFVPCSFAPHPSPLPASGERGRLLYPRPNQRRRDGDGASIPFSPSERGEDARQGG